jgi:hypothetical protein
MKFEEIKRWKSELLSERKNEHDAIDAKYERKLAAIEVLLEDEGRSSKPTQGMVVSLGNEYRKAMNKLSATRDGISKFPDRFTTAMVFNYVNSTYPGLVKKPSDLSNSVWLLKKNDEIAVVKEGAGPANPAEYRTTPKFRPLIGNGA